MLFSNADVVRFMGELYECAWESVRAVPRVEIDFGDGRKLTRTLQGNVATYLCMSDGRVVDIVPGLATPAEYMSRLDRGAAFIKRLPERAASLVSDYHTELARGVTAERIAELRSFVDASKGAIERPLKGLLADALEDLQPKPDMRKRKVESRMKDALSEDVAYNVEVRMPKIHQLLAEKPLAMPAELKARLFRDVLGYDIEDPWLGLAPLVLGGEGGRHE